MDKISSEYNMNEKNIIKDYLNYVIACKQDYINSDFLLFAQFIMHLRDPNIDYLRSYFFKKYGKMVILVRTRVHKTLHQTFIKTVGGEPLFGSKKFCFKSGTRFHHSCDKFSQG